MARLLVLLAKPTVRRAVFAMIALALLFTLSSAALMFAAPLFAQPVGPDAYPAPAQRTASGCDAFVALSQVRPPAEMRAVSMALAEARGPWSEIDRAKYVAGVALELEPAAEAFARAKSCPSFQDGRRGQVGVHHVLRAALLALVSRELDAPGSTRSDLLDYVRLVSERARSARTMLTLHSALDLYVESLPLLARAGVARPFAASVDRKRDGGRIARLELAPCRAAVTRTKAQLGFDPGRTYAGCLHVLGPWIEHFEHGAARPPEAELTTTSTSWRNVDGDQLVDSFALAVEPLRALSNSFDLAEAAEKPTTDAR